jgi:hypothetical protein
MLARVYTILGEPGRALHHAKRCFALTEKHGFKDFDLAYANEAMARAYALNDNAMESKRYYSQAKEAGEKIAETEDRELRGDCFVPPIFIRRNSQ